MACADRSVPVVIGSGRLESQKDFEDAATPLAVRPPARACGVIPRLMMILGEGSACKGACNRLATSWKFAADSSRFPGLSVRPSTALHVLRCRVACVFRA